jgi:hypothetical protein
MPNHFLGRGQLVLLGVLGRVGHQIRVLPGFLKNISSLNPKLFVSRTRVRDRKRVPSVPMTPALICTDMESWLNYGAINHAVGCGC